MIAPSMATMLTVVTTDAVVDAPVLDAALRAAVRVSFDRLDIDGCMSTNDTVLLLASGRLGGRRPTPRRSPPALTDLCRDLARQMQADAEGVTKRITVRVTGAATEDEAVTIARTVARDSLVKTALFGSDPNWGRIAAAVGYADAARRPGAARRHDQRRAALPRRGGRGRPRRRRHVRARTSSSRSRSASATAPRRSSPPTCPTPTSRRTVPTPLEPRGSEPGAGREKAGGAGRGAALAAAVPRPDRRGQVRRQRHDRRGV